MLHTSTRGLQLQRWNEGEGREECKFLQHVPWTFLAKLRHWRDFDALQDEAFWLFDCEVRLEWHVMDLERRTVGAFCFLQISVKYATYRFCDACVTPLVILERLEAKNSKAERASCASPASMSQQTTTVPVRPFPPYKKR